MDNPMLSKIKDMSEVYERPATYGGVAIKSIGLVAIVMASAIATWIGGYATPVTTAVTGICGLVVALIVSFKPNTAGFLAPLYAIFEGMCLACLSVSLNAMYPGIVLNAVMLTFSIALGAGMVYAKGWVTVDARFMRMTSIAVLGVLIAYVLEFVLSFFGISFPMLHEGGIIGIGVSLLVIGVATMCLFTDYEFISQAVREGLPESYEWYCSFSLLVTLVWLYVEVLDLLRKIAMDRD